MLLEKEKGSRSKTEGTYIWRNVPPYREVLSEMIVRVRARVGPKPRMGATRAVAIEDECFHLQSRIAKMLITNNMLIARDLHLEQGSINVCIIGGSKHRHFDRDEDPQRYSLSLSIHTEMTLVSLRGPYLVPAAVIAEAK